MIPIQPPVAAPPRVAPAPMVPTIQPVPQPERAQSQTRRDEQDAERRRSATPPALYGPNGKREARQPGSTISVVA